jgi:hypothetical protein
MNAATTVTIAAKVVGQKKPVFTDWRIPLPPEQDGSRPLTLRDLITLIVVKEVSDFQQRQEQRKLAQIFTKAQIDEGAAKGKIDMGERDFNQQVDELSAVAAALQAFEDGLYFVFIDEVQHESLDQSVYIHETSHILFVRLVALAGG